MAWLYLLILTHQELIDLAIGSKWVDALEYTDLTPAIGRPTDNRVYEKDFDGQPSGQSRHWKT